MMWFWPVVKWTLVADVGLVLVILALRGWLRRRTAHQWLDAVRSVQQKRWRQQKRRRR